MFKAPVLNKHVATVFLARQALFCFRQNRNKLDILKNTYGVSILLLHTRSAVAFASAVAPILKVNKPLYATCTSPKMHLVNLAPKILHKHCFQFLLERVQYPGDLKNKG